MEIGLLTLQIHLHASASLKDKRRVIKSLTGRVRSRHNVAVAEIDHQDLWQRATLGIVGIAAARVPLEQTFSSIQSEVERKVPGEVLSCDLEFLT